MKVSVAYVMFISAQELQMEMSYYLNVLQSNSAIMNRGHYNCWCALMLFWLVMNVLIFVIFFKDSDCPRISGALELGYMLQPQGYTRHC